MFAGMPKEKESILRKSYWTLVVALLIKAAGYPACSVDFAVLKINCVMIQVAMIHGHNAKLLSNHRKNICRELVADGDPDKLK